MRSADLLFLPMHDLPVGVRARTVAGKTYEYLAAGRPVLAALPDGDARDLTTGWPGVWTCRPTDVPCLVLGLRHIVERGRGHDIEAPSRLADYERTAIARRITSVFDGLIGHGDQPIGDATSVTSRETSQHP
jgi:hypothetical protein